MKLLEMIGLSHAIGLSVLVAFAGLGAIVFFIVVLRHFRKIKKIFRDQLIGS